MFVYSSGLVSPFSFPKRKDGGQMSYEIEEVERAALEDLNAAVTETLGRELGMKSRSIGGAFASAFAALPDSAIVVNRTIGLGLSGAESNETIDEVIALYESAGIGRYFLHVHPDTQPSDMGERLERRGLEKARGWMKFLHSLKPPPEVSCDLEIRTALPEDATEFGHIEADAFDLGSAGAALPALLVGRPHWHVYVSLCEGRLAGAGILFAKDGVAWLDWGATSPEFRGRRSQSALLNRRISDALDLGCRLIATTTGEEVPGDPQISYRNIVKMGFEPAYVRRNFAPPKT